MTFDGYYGLEPWSAWSINQRDWWVPEVLWAFSQQSNLQQLIPTTVDFKAKRTKKMTWTGLWDLEPSWDAIATRSLWLPRMHPAGWQQEMELYTYGSGMGMHKYDDLVTFFDAGGGIPALRGLMRKYVAGAIVRHMEQLAFAAYQTKPNVYIMGGGTGFSAIGASDVYNPDVALELGLDFRYMEIKDPSTGGVPCLAFVSPGQTYSFLTNATDWTGVMQYSSLGLQKLLNYEIGAWKGISRHMEHPVHTMYNAGTLLACAPVTSAITPGDGALDPATGTTDGVKKVGETTATNYIQLDSTVGNWDVDDASDGMANFQVGDIVTIYTRQSPGTTDPFDVQYAPLPSDGTLCYRQIVAIDAGNFRLSFDRPIQKDYTTEGANDCGAGQYAFVAKGMHIHCAIVQAAAGGVAAGWADPIKVMFPPAVDDRLAQFRVTWDGVGRYALFTPEVFHLVYTAGPVSKKLYLNYGNEK